ncbi:MAG: cupin domain-containing protein [Hyphomonadaceae bacterium]
MRRIALMLACSLATLTAAPPARAQAGDAPLPEVRLTESEIAAMGQTAAGPGPSAVLVGDPTKPGPYAMQVRIAPNQALPPHTHRDNRVTRVLSGTYFYGYGATADEAKAKKLTAGSFYTEPAGQAHFAHAGPEGAVLYVVGTGPSDTKTVTPQR